MGLEDISIGIEATGADTTADAINKVTTAVKGLNDTPVSGVTTLATNLDTVKTAATGVNTPITTAATGVKTLGGAYDETATKSKTLGDTFTDLGTKSGTASTNFKSFATAMVGAAGSITLISSGIIGIVEGYTQMERAQTGADRASNRYQQGLILLQTDQKKVNDLIAQGKQGTPEYTKALETLTLQQDKNKTNLEFMTEAQQHASEAMANFATQVIPEVINVVGGVATAITTVPKAIDAMKAAFNGVSTATDTASTAAKAASAEFKTVGTTAETTGASVKLMSVAMAAIPFAVGAGLATAFIVGIQQIYAHTADVHAFFTQLGTDVETVVPHAKQSFVEMGDAVTSTATFFKIGLDRISNELHLTNINQDITKEKMSELMTQVRDTGSTTVAKFDEQTKAYIKGYTDTGKSIDYAIEKEKQNEDSQAKAAAATAKSAEELKHYQEASKLTGDSLEKDLTAKITGLTAALTGVVPGLQSFGSAGTTIRTVFTELGKEMETFGSIPVKATADYVKFGTDVSASLVKLKPAFKDLGTDAGQILTQALNDAKAAMGGNSEAATRLTGDLKLVNQVIHDNSDAVTQAKGAEILHRDILVDVAAKNIGYANAVKLTNTQLEASNKTFSELTNKVKDESEASLKAGMAEDLHREALVQSVAAHIGLQAAQQLTNKQLEDAKKLFDDGSGAVKDLSLALGEQALAQQSTNRLANESALAYGEVKKAELDQIDTIAKLQGTLKADNEDMKNHTTTLNDMKEGYLKANEEVTKWSRSIDDSIGAQKGTHDGLQTLVNDYGIDFPASVIKTNDQMRTWIGIVRGAPAEIDKLNTSIDSIGTAFDTGLSQAAQKGTKDLQSFLTGLPDLVKKYTPPGLLAAAFSKGQALDTLTQFKQELGIGISQVGTDPNIIQQLTQATSGFLQNMQQAAAKDPVAAKVFQPIFDAITKNPPTTLEGFQKLFALIDTVLTSTGQSATGAGLGLGKIAPAAQPIPGAVDPATKAMHGLLDTFITQNIKPMMDVLDALPNLFKIAFSEAGTSISALNTSSKTALDTFQANIKPEIDLVQSLAGLFKTAFNQAGQAADGLNSSSRVALDTFRANIKPEIDLVQSLAGLFKTAFQQAGQAADSLNSASKQPLDTFRANVKPELDLVQSLPALFQTAFNQAGQNVNAMVTASASAFQTMSSRISSLMQQLQQLAQASQQVGQQTQASQYGAGGQPGVYGYSPYQTMYAQHGFVGVVDKPTSFVVGEAGPEYVSVIPGGGAGQISNTMFVGLQDIVTNITRANLAMNAVATVVNKNNTALNDATTAQNLHSRSLNDQNIKLNVNNLAVDSSTAALGHATVAVNNTSAALDGSGVTAAAANASGGLQVVALSGQGASQSVFSMIPAAIGINGAFSNLGATSNQSTGALTGMSGAANQSQMALVDAEKTQVLASQATQAQSAAANQAGSSLNQTSGAAGQASQGLNSAGQSASSAGGSIGSFSSQMQQAGQAASSFAQAANSAATSLATAARSAAAAPAASPYGAGGTNPYQYGAGGYPSTLSGYNPATNPQLGQFYANQAAAQQYYYMGAQYGGNLWGFAKGFEGFVTSPTKFIAGEAGPEYVSVIPGANVDVGNTMTSGLTGLVNTINKSNSAMSTTWAAATNNTIMFNKTSVSLGGNANAVDNSSDALNKHRNALNNNQVGLLNCNGALTNTTNALGSTTSTLNNTSTALNNTSTAANGTITALDLIPQPSTAAATGLNGTAGAANNATGAINNMASSMQQASTRLGAGGGAAGGGVQGPSGVFSGLASQIGPSGGGAVPAVFAPYAQYGNFSGTSPAPAQGAAYYGGPPSGGGGGGQYGAFGAYSQYGNFGGGGGGSQPQQQSGSQGGIVGSQGGSSSPAQQQPTGGASYYGGPPSGYQSSPYGAFGAYASAGKFAASGFDGIVDRATRFIAGEAGPEHVKVTPIGNIASSANDVNSIMAMIAELVRQIAGQTMNINLNSYLDGERVYRNQQKYTNGRLGNYLG